jgi:uncharacterized protein
MAETTSQLNTIIGRFRDELAKLGIQAEQILLFGSQAHGTAHEWSDIDLIVISSDWTGYNERERLEITGVAAIRLLAPIHAQGFTPDEIANHELTSFWEYVLADAVLVAA